MVAENWLMRETHQPEQDNVTWEWKKWSNEKFHDFNSLSNINRMIKLRRMLMRRVWRTEVCTGLRFVNVREIRYLENQDVDGKINLNWL
jgi:hypothetical protein